MTINIRFRVDFANRCSIGPGKISLLEAIGNSGSLSQAARDLRMSYRRAWLLAASMNDSFQEPVTRAATGGKRGGGMVLTKFGKTVVKTYREFELDILKRASVRMRTLSRYAVKSDQQRVPTRPLKPGP